MGKQFVLPASSSVRLVGSSGANLTQIAVATSAPNSFNKLPACCRSLGVDWGRAADMQMNPAAANPDYLFPLFRLLLLIVIALIPPVRRRTARSCSSDNFFFPSNCLNQAVN